MPVTRKNQSSLTPDERAAFVRALKLLKAAPSQCTPPTRGRYDDYVYIHMQAMLVLSITDPSKPVENGNWTSAGDMRMPMWAHRCPAFFPWHRELLHQFELDLQRVSGDPNMALPYWDWSVSQSPSALPWTDDLLGGDGGNGPVTTGPFAGPDNWKLNISEDNADRLMRGFGADPIAPRLPSPDEVAAALQASPYDQEPWSDQSADASFRNQVEGWYVPPGSPLQIAMHNLVHVWVGGTNGTMLPSTSPNDPAFFLHHCNVDRVWALWQTARQPPFFSPAAPLDGEPGQSLNEPMTFFDPNLSSTPPWTDPPATPMSVIDHRRLGYVYDTDAPSPQLDALHELNRQVLAVPQPPPGPVDPAAFRILQIRPQEHFRFRRDQLLKIRQR
jgi:tyrosinase